MSDVGKHLGIRLGDYDRDIRRFIPYYAEVHAVIAASIGRPGTVVELGVGNGALARLCRRNAKVIGIDADPGMLPLARKRLGPDVRLVEGDFESFRLPRCGAIVAAYSLHHIPTKARKNALYAKCRAALRPGGRLLIGDCFPAREPALQREHMRDWRHHLERYYSPRHARELMQQWRKEDTYFCIQDELAMLQSAGFAPEVVWRLGGFAVLSGGDLNL